MYPSKQEASRLGLRYPRRVNLESVHSALLRGSLPAATLDLSASGWGAAISFDAALAQGHALELVPGPMHHEAHWRQRLSMARASVTSLHRGDARLYETLGGDGDDFLRAWRSLAFGGPEVDLGAASKRARDEGLADLVVECSVLRALKAEGEGRLEDALRHARRASMMARNESLPQSEYLAGVTLARVRRRMGFPHLAIQILRTLEDIASPHWRAWIGWELTLAGDPRPEKDAAFLQSLCARPSLPSPPGLATFALQDAELIRALLDPRKVEPADHVPSGFASLVGEINLVCWPSQPARTLGQRGVEFADVAPFDGMTRRRIASLVASLGRQSPQEEAACFKSIYGFQFVPEMHRGTFDVLLHRTRTTLNGYAEIERSDEQVRMQVLRAFAIADPRHAERREARLLRVLAAGGQTARDAARAAGLSTRQAQSLLKELAGDGLCVAERVGRAIFYRVEDTCFSEPTRGR